MGNCMLGFPNRLDEGVLASGSWTAGLPLTNLQNRILGVLARSASTGLSSTKFTIELTEARATRIVALVNHNFSLNAYVRIRGNTSNSFTTPAYDSGWLEVWPAVYPSSSLLWEDSNWWTGKPTEEQITGYIKTFVHVLPPAKKFRYWQVEIDDTTNAAGYVQLGRVFIGSVWQPVVNPSYGLSYSWETKTDVQTALGGAEYFARRTPNRTVRLSLDWMSDDEALVNAFELDRMAGIDKEVMWVHDPNDTVHALRRRFLSRIRALNPIENPLPNIQRRAYELKELL